jgi:hypothetical protein
VLGKQCRVVVNACDRPTAAGSDVVDADANEEARAFDVVLLPEELVVRQLRPEQVPALVDALFGEANDTEKADDNATSSFAIEPLHANAPADASSTFGSTVLICSHKKRDRRCGELGPLLREEFHQQLQDKPALQDRVQVYQVTHVGGILMYNVHVAWSIFYANILRFLL